MKNKHFLFLMVLLAFAIFVFAMAFTGCSAENPICSTNFCAVGEVFPRSELDDDATFSEVDIDDTQLIAVFGTIPTPAAKTTPLESNVVPLADILSDVAAGNTTYLNKTVTVTGFVVYRDTKGKDAIVINETNTLTPLTTAFFIEDFGNPATFDVYTIGQSYTFTVNIYTITPPEGDKAYYSLFSKFPDETDE